MKKLFIILTLFFICGVSGQKTVAGLGFSFPDEPKKLTAIKTDFGIQILDSNEAKFYVPIDGLTEQQAKRIIDIINAYRIINSGN